MRTRFVAPACVCSTFTAADGRAAVEPRRQGIALDAVRHAIWLDCAYRYAAMLNGRTGASITRLRYFGPIVEEVIQSGLPAN